jgi:hypothetical protein
MFRNIMSGILAFLFGTFITIAFFEASFRVLPVTDATHAQPVNNENPYFHFLPERNLRFSLGWNFSISNRKKVNNYGFFTDYDFTPEDSSPLIGVIGDSYVEAKQVANEDTMHGILGKELERRGRVYGVGFSGAPLSQYLAYSRFMADEFSPDALVFIIIGNDFDESMLKYKSDPGFHYFDCEADSACPLVRIDYQGKSALNNLATKSSILRYINSTLNIPLVSIPQILFPPDTAEEVRFVGNVRSEVDEERLEYSRRAVDLFLERLPEYSRLSPERILFVIDAMRPSIYSDKALEADRGSYFDLMRGYFSERAARLGFEVIDMQPVFLKRYKETGEEFEFYPIDAHWNELGHRLVADRISESSVFKRLHD